MMKNNRRKLFYIVISVLAAALTWFYVNDPMSVIISVNDIPVEFLNEDTTLAERGLMLLKQEESTIDLKLQMPRNLVFFLDTDKIRIVADLSAITASGKQSVSYTILYPPNIPTRSITVESPAVRTTQVQIGELSRKEVEVRCKVVGNVADGYTAGTLHLLPASLELRGQQVDIMQVNYAEVTLNIDNASSTIVKLLDYQLYDFNDQVINNPNIHPVADQIEVKLPVMTVKEVPLTIEFIEAPGARLDSYRYKLDYEMITISGEASTVDSIEEISLGTLALDDLEPSESIIFEIVLPDGVNNLSGITTAMLTVEDIDMANASLVATQFGYANFGANREVDIVTSFLNVTLRGRQEDIEAITPEDVHVVANLIDVADASGSYSVPAEIQIDHYDVGAIGSYEVTVRIGNENEA